MAFAVNSTAFMPKRLVMKERGSCGGATAVSPWSDVETAVLKDVSSENGLLSVASPGQKEANSS